MDGVYSSWATSVPAGFSDDQIAALRRIEPYLALAIKSVSVARMTGTLMETYLGRDAGRASFTFFDVARARASS
jgi:adenylate cyclase